MIEAGVTICCGAVVYAGARLGAGTIIGDQAQVRERATIGEGTVVGRGSAVEFGAQVGARVSIQTGVYVTALSIVEDDVFLGPGVVTTNDDTMARHDHSEALRGPVLRRACRIGGGAVLVPGVEIGEEAFVAAGERRRPRASGGDGRAGTGRARSARRRSDRAVVGEASPPVRVLRRTPGHTARYDAVVAAAPAIPSLAFVQMT